MNQFDALTVLQMHDLFGEEPIEDLTAAVKVLAPVVDGREHNKTDAHPEVLAGWVQAANLDIVIAKLHEEAAARDAAELAEQEQADDA
jgi:hypothetical protein